MEARWIVYCEKNGCKTEPVLEWFNSEYDRWEMVDYVELKKEWRDE